MIEALVLLIEDQMKRGRGTDWSNKDFELLGEEIFKVTKKRLSVTTLKRIWGRAEMVAKPSVATLDILAEFSGYIDWRDFERQGSPKKVNVEFPFSKKRMKQFTILFVALVVALGIRFFVRSETKATSSAHIIDPAHFAFNSRVVSTDIPNSVVFEYDASSAPADARIEIQQDWDERKRIMVRKEDSVATCIYYRPGFFESKLVVNGTIVKEADVFIKTPGWLGTINKDSVPIYLDHTDILNDGTVGITKGNLERFSIDSKQSAITTSLFYVEDFTDLDTNDFEASFLIKNDFDDVLGRCQEIEVYILYEGGVIGIPLGRKGCISNFNLIAFDRYINGKTTDLSAFGVEFDDFVAVICSSTEQRLQIYINGHLAITLPKKDIPHGIKGLSAHFQGVGTIKNVVFKNSMERDHNLTE